MTRTLTLAVLAALAALTGLSATARAIPEPESVPVRWEFDFKPDPLRLIRLEDENGVPTWYAYLTYRVSNHTTQDRMFAPLFELADDTGTVVRSGRGVHVSVTRRIMDTLDDPLLQDQLSIVSTLLQGIENTRRGLVIWKLPSTITDELAVFAAGFSGESEAFYTADPDTGERIRHLLRKSRMLRYDMPGEVTEDSSPTPALRESRWILR